MVWYGYGMYVHTGAFLIPALLLCVGQEPCWFLSLMLYCTYSTVSKSKLCKYRGRGVIEVILTVHRVIVIVLTYSTVQY